MNFNNVLQLYDIEIFDDINLPQRLDRDLVINTIIDKCFEYKPLYYELAILKPKIENFFNKNYRSYEKLTDAYFLEYDMIVNYDKISTITINGNTSTSTDSNVETDVNTKQDVSTYDSNNYQPSTSDASKQNEKMGSSSNSTSNDTTTEETKGNIGVTTSQQMIESEIALRKKLRIYDIIANDFFKEFMLRNLY